jgi:monoamine oxidase
VDLGGAFVHWTQPHLWSELTRYGLGIVPYPDPEREFLLSADGIHELRPEDLEGFPVALEAFSRDASAVLRNPMETPTSQVARAVDKLSTRDRLDAMDLPARQMDLLDSLGAGLGSAPNERSGYLSTLALSFALAGFSADLLFETNGRWTIRGGTRSLVDMMSAELLAEIRLGAVVERIEQDRDGVTVFTRDGHLRAKAAILAVPVSTLGDIRFEPALAPMKQEAARVGLVGLGSKIFASLAPGSPTATSQAPDRFPISFVETVGINRDGGTVVTAFAHSADLLTGSDDRSAATAIEEMLPGAHVEEIGGHDWTNDPFSRETWAVYAPGTWLRWATEIDRMEGRVAFAGSDIARGWRGYIDGAIETGLHAAREVEAILE